MKYAGGMSDTEPRWLDEDQQQTWMAITGLLMRLPGALDAQLQREAGITHFEYAVMAGLSTPDSGTMRMSELAEMSNSMMPRLSQVVTRLEKRGWVRREPDPSDGRATLASLTAEGWAKLTESAPGHVAEVRRVVFDPLTKTQQRHLRDAARRIVQAITPDEPCLGGQA